MAQWKTSHIVRLAQRSLRNREGSTAILFALALPVLLMATASAVDVGMGVRQKARLQSVVDAAALAAARELSMSNSKTDNVSSVVQALAANYSKASYLESNDPTPVLSTTVSTSPLQVKVTAEQPFVAFFGNTLGLVSRDFTASATAQVIGKPNICVLVLDPSANGALSLEQSANVTGKDCAVYSNSTHNTGILAKGMASLTAMTICSAGGVQGGGANFDPPPYFDCPTFDDPLASRPEPSVGHCFDPGVTEIKTSGTLMPGTYCGLTIANGAVVEFSPGVYTIKDAPLIVKDGAQINGKGVGFFLTGAGAHVDFEADSGISLEAPTSGPMTGLLLFAARSSTSGNQHKIFSENAQNMVGTIYLPSGELRVDGAASIGSQAAYTAIVANRVQLYGGPHIVLNTNYDQTDVPVPEGIKGAGQPVHLVE